MGFLKKFLGSKAKYRVFKNWVEKIFFVRVVGVWVGLGGQPKF